MQAWRERYLNMKNTFLIKTFTEGLGNSNTKEFK